MTAEDKAVEAKARCIAQKHGYFAIKSTKRTLSAENGGGFMLVQAATNCIKAGERFDMSAEQVITFFGEDQA